MILLFLKTFALSNSREVPVLERSAIFIVLLILSMRIRWNHIN